jgi:UDP-N-acetylmuramoyl-tripeptide--D-alanyl-D-alanine ligase
VTALWTSQEIAEALGGSVQGTWEATGISIDTRTLQPGDLYIALHGDTHDGHAFVADAYAKGAVAAIVDHPVGDRQSFQVIVQDTLKALESLGAYARTRTKAAIIAVTGSVGKTTTKEMLRHVLSAFGETFASPASYNNHWGVPFSLASIPRDAAYGVFEIGMNHPGEIAPLSCLVRPHIAVITALADAHIGNMGSREAIAREKADIFAGITTPGLAIINQDTPEFETMKQRAIARGVSQVLGFGKSVDAVVRLIEYHPDAKGMSGIANASLSGQTITYTLPQPGEHIALNSLVVLAIGESLGLDWGRLTQKLQTFLPLSGRGQQHRLSLKGGDVLLIDDAYNANLTSMQAGLSILAAIPVSAGGRRIAVLGEMLELGDQAPADHCQLMDEALARPIDLVFAAGSSVMEAAFRKIPPEKAGGYAPLAEELVYWIEKTLRPGDVILVKGSKGSHVSKIVKAFLNRPSQKAG